MTVVQSILDSPRIQWLGWTLLHSLWEGAAVALVLMVALRMMRGAVAGMRYAVSCVAFLAALAIPVLTFLVLQPAPSASPRVLMMPQASVLPARSTAVTQTGNRTAQSPTPAVQPLIVRSMHTSIAQAAPARLIVASRLVSSRVVGALHTAIPWLVPVWACGVTLLSLRNLGGWVAIQRRKVLSRCDMHQEIGDMANRLRRRLKSNRAVRLLTSSKAVSPMVVGVFNPLILLPASVLRDLSAAQLESILAHGLTFVRRHDYLANLVQTVIETLMFYHPAVWWIGRRIRIERENCCDNVAVSLSRDRVGYVRAFALVAGGAPTLASAGGGSLMARVRRILGFPERDVAGAPRWLSGALVLAVVLSIVAVLRPRIPAAHATPAKPLGPGTLSGTVVDAQGRPIAGAKVVFQAYDETVGHRAPAAEAVTGVAGHFRVGPIVPDYRHRWDLQIEAEGVGFQYVPGETYSVYPGTDYDLGRIQVEKGRVFSGQVLDWDGKPVRGAIVEYGVLRLVLGHTADEVLPTRKLATDAGGRFRTPPLPVGLLTIDVYVPERQRAGWGWDLIAPGGEEELKPVRLKKDVPIAGTVRDEQGQPITGAIIGANDHPEVYSNDAGQYVLHGFGPAPELQVHVSKPGYVFINRVAEQKPDGWRYAAVGPGDHPWTGPVRQLDFVMKREAWVAGRAIDAETGEPVRLQRVVMCRFDRQPDGHILLSSCLSADFQQPHSGEFRIHYPFPDEYHLTFTAEGYDDAEAFTPKVDHLQTIEGLIVKMKRQTGAEKATVRSQRISGMVTRDGQPVKTGWVGLWGLQGTENVVNSPMMRGRTVERERIVYRSALIENGRYTIEIPNPGNDWYVVAEEPGRAITQVGPITIAPEEYKTLDIQCVEGGRISGHVDDIPAGWAGSVWVIAFTRTGVRTEARIDATGNFSLANLPPGEYGLKAGYDGFRDSEVPEKETPKDWKTPTQPWRRATVVTVESAREIVGVGITLPSN